MNKQDKISIEAVLIEVPGNTTKEGLIRVAQEHFSNMKAEEAVELAEISLRLGMCTMLSCSQAIERVKSIVRDHCYKFKPDYWQKFREEWFNETPVR